MKTAVETVPGTIHLRYAYHAAARLRERSLCELIETAATLAGKPPADFSALDIGCGSGHLLKAARERGLNVKGADLDPVCVQLSNRYAETFPIGKDPLDHYFDRRSYDCLIFSHSLEHFDHPLDAVLQAKNISRGFLIVAVPNPCRLQTMLVSNPFRYDYSNLGHLCCWDRSHLTYFLTERCGLEIVRWHPYKVAFATLPSAFLRALKGTRLRRNGIQSAEIDRLSYPNNKNPLTRLVKKTLEPIEVVLARVLPYFADELLVLTRCPESRPMNRDTGEVPATGIPTGHQR